VANDYFSFRQFTIYQNRSAFKVGTDGVLLGACAVLSGASSIFEIGTGTGLIAIMCAQRSEAHIIAIEPERNSFQQAVENSRSSKWSDRISVLNSDLLNFASQYEGKFDVIISNPPYFRGSLLNPDKVRASARHTFSLSSGDLLGGCEKLLNQEGNLQVILPYEEGTFFIAEAGGKGLYCNSIIKIKPVPEGKVIRLIMKFERVKRQTHEKFLTIETGTRHNYTEEYKEFTRDFYLKF
jgi:tRNA1Val (adenine37-N6)-methyltransferase